MIDLKSLLKKNLYVFIASSSVILLIKRFEVLYGLFFGMTLCFLNFVFLQKSVKIIIQRMTKHNGEGVGFSQLKEFFIKYFLKLFLVVLLLVLMIKFLQVNVIGLLIGFILATFVYIFELTRIRCQLSQKP